MPRLDLLKKIRALDEEQDKVIPWSELEVDAVFQVLSVRKAFENKFRESHILDLQNIENDKKCRVFSIDRLPINNFYDKTKEHFLIPKALKPCKNGQFYKFSYISEPLEA